MHAAQQEAERREALTADLAAALKQLDELPQRGRKFLSQRPKIKQAALSGCPVWTADEHRES